MQMRLQSKTKSFGRVLKSVSPFFLLKKYFFLPNSSANSMLGIACLLLFASETENEKRKWNKKSWETKRGGKRENKQTNKQTKY